MEVSNLLRSPEAPMGDSREPPFFRHYPSSMRVPAEG